MLTLMLEYFLFSLLTTSQDQMVFRHKTIMGFWSRSKTWIFRLYSSFWVSIWLHYASFLCRPLNGIRSSLLTFLHSLGRRIVGWRGNLHHSYAPVNTCNCFIFMFNFACKSFWLYYASSTLKQNLAKSSELQINVHKNFHPLKVIHSNFLPFCWGFVKRS